MRMWQNELAACCIIIIINNPVCSCLSCTTLLISEGWRTCVSCPNIATYAEHVTYPLTCSLLTSQSIPDDILEVLDLLEPLPDVHALPDALLGSFSAEGGEFCFQRV